MERRLTAQGPKDRKSYMVTLPLDWVKSKGLDKLRTVNIELLGNTAIITPPSRVKEKVEIDSDRYKYTIERVLAELYIMGVDEIKLIYKDSKMIERIRPIINDRMMGFEILEHSKDYLIIKSIAKESEEEFDTILRRVFLLLNFISERILNNIKNKDYVLLPDLSESYKSLFRLANFCLRSLIKKGHSDYYKTCFYYNLCEELKTLCNRYKRLYNEIIKSKDKKPDIENLLFKLNNSLGILYKLYYSFDINKFEEARWNIISMRDYLITAEHKYKLHLLEIAGRINALYSCLLYTSPSPRD